MAKKYITVRFYRHADADLMALYTQDNKQMGFFMKEALRQFVEGEDRSLQVPPYNDNIPMNRTRASTHVILDTEKDALLIDALNMVPTGYRCAFLKNITRYQMVRGYTDIYFGDALKGKST